MSHEITTAILVYQKDCILSYEHTYQLKSLLGLFIRLTYLLDSDCGYLFYCLWLQADLRFHFHSN